MGIGAGLGDNVALAQGSVTMSGWALEPVLAIKSVQSERAFHDRSVEWCECRVPNEQGVSASFQPEILTRTPFLGPFIGCAKAPHNNQNNTTNLPTEWFAILS